MRTDSDLKSAHNLEVRGAVAVVAACSKRLPFKQLQLREECPEAAPC